MKDPPLQIVLLHGITGSRRIFAGLEGRLRLAPVFAETYSLDLLGFGENLKARSEFTPIEQLEWIGNSVRKRFPSGSIVLVGHSLGGVLALAWAIGHASRVSRIVLLNTPLGESRQDIVSSLTREHASWATLLLRYKPLAHLLCAVLRRAHIAHPFHFAKPDYVPEEVLVDYTKHSWKSLENTFDTVLLGLPAMPLVRQVESIPVLNLTGADDGEISRRVIDQANVKNVVLPGGHLMLLEHPAEPFEAIEQFLASVS